MAQNFNKVRPNTYKPLLKALQDLAASGKTIRVTTNNMPGDDGCANGSVTRKFKFEVKGSFEKSIIAISEGKKGLFIPISNTNEVQPLKAKPSAHYPSDRDGLVFYKIEPNGAVYLQYHFPEKHIAKRRFELV